MRWVARAVALAGLAALAGCGPAHQLDHLPNGDNSLVAVVDYAASNFGLSHDAIVSVQEPKGIAASVATFGNITHIEVSWLSPVDLNICQAGKVLVYKTAVPLNTSKGMRTVHVRYGC